MTMCTTSIRMLILTVSISGRVAAKDPIKAVARDTKTAAVDTGKVTDRGVRDAGKAVNKAGRATGRTVDDTGRITESGVRKAGRGVKKAFDPKPPKQ